MELRMGDRYIWAESESDIGFALSIEFNGVDFIVLTATDDQRGQDRVNNPVGIPPQAVITSPCWKFIGNYGKSKEALDFWDKIK